ncbi:MAG: hypothetical protein CMA80_01630 [Euryarchaeota archaeon]|nr:hypothetical protein [Euryarchaeota archaeon]
MVLRPCTEEQAFITHWKTFGPVESPKMNPVFVAQRCCLRCGRVENIGTESIDRCADCEAMAFNID